ncbi:hypothetical protein BDC45DRAFT_605996 [Circinella umbellata]|nr:hypothetical protein BDC45DRAFT_605996 [Circinella umbellata]
MSTTAMSTTAMSTTAASIFNHHQDNSGNLRRPTSSFLPPHVNGPPITVKKRMVTVQDISSVHNEEPMQGLLIVQSDSEYEEDDDEEDDNDSTTTSTSTPNTPGESEDTKSHYEEDDVEEKLSSGSTTTTCFSLPQQQQRQEEGELLLVPTHLETIQESLDSTIEDDACSRISIHNEDQYIVSSLLKDEKTSVESDQFSVASSVTSLQKQENHQPSHVSEELTVAQQQQREPMNYLRNMPLSSNLKKSSMELLVNSPETTIITQKPFEPPSTNTVMTTTTTTHQMVQIPHTPEESKPPTIWSVDATNSDYDDHDDDQSLPAAVSLTNEPPVMLRKRVSKEELQEEQQELPSLTVQTTVGALSSSASLCSRCSSSVGNGPSSATSAISSQEQQLRLLTRPASVISFSSGPNSMYNNPNNNHYHQQPLLMHQQQQSLPAPSPQQQQQQQQFVAPTPQETSSASSVLHKSNSSPQLFSDPLAPIPCSQSKLSIASFSLTHNKDAIKTYRRMASKTNNRSIQMTYAKYLLDVARLYSTTAASNNNNGQQRNNNKINSDNIKTREKLLSEAGYWIERLAKWGHPEALYIKGKWQWHPEQEESVPDSYRAKPQPLKAYRSFQNAARGGCVDAYYELARYQKAHGKYSLAVSCYEKAAKKGHTLANYKMAKILLRGQLQQKRNINLGLEYLKKAADAQGVESAEPAFDLSCIYSDDLECIGIARDSQMSRKNELLAIQYLQKAANSGSPKALHRMGVVHEYGLLGQPQSPWQGYSFYTRAAEDGCEEAMLNLSRLYASGIPGYLMQQHEMAFKWCHRAALKGLGEAEYVLGTYYEDGIGTAPDFNRGLEWFSRAASKGHAGAAEKLNLPKNAFSSTSSVSLPQLVQNNEFDQEETNQDTQSKLTSLRRKATFELVHQTATVVAATADQTSSSNFRNVNNNHGANPSDGNCTIM